MPAQKAATSTTPKKAAATPVHGSYKEMIQGAILALKERNGCSRAALKKYVQANNNGVEGGAKFDSQFNRAVKSGVDQGIFAQPKGTSGPIKLAKKEPASKPASKPATEKKPATKKASAKSKASTTTPTTKKAAAPKKTAATTTKTKATKPSTKKSSTTTSGTTKKATSKPVSNTGAKRTTKKTPTAAPAVVEEKMVLGKTKTGRVTKTKVSAVTGVKPGAKKTPKSKTTSKKAASKDLPPAAEADADAAAA